MEIRGHEKACEQDEEGRPKGAKMEAKCIGKSQKGHKETQRGGTMCGKREGRKSVEKKP